MAYRFGGEAWSDSIAAVTGDPRYQTASIRIFAPTTEPTQYDFETGQPTLPSDAPTYVEPLNFATQPVPVIGQSGWNANSGDSPVVRDSSVFRRPGTASMRSTRSPSNPDNVLASLYSVGALGFSNEQRTTVSAGEEIVGSVYGRASVPALFRVTISFYDAQNQEILPARATSPLVPSPFNEWTRVHQFAEAPDGAVSVMVSASAQTPGQPTSGGEQVWFGDAMISRSRVLLDYMDGYDPGAGWVGATGISASGPVRATSETPLYEGQARIIGVRWGTFAQGDAQENSTSIKSVRVQIPKDALPRIEHGSYVLFVSTPKNPALESRVLTVTSDFQGSSSATRTFECSVDSDSVVG